MVTKRDTRSLDYGSNDVKQRARCRAADLLHRHDLSESLVYTPSHPSIENARKTTNQNPNST